MDFKIITNDGVDFEITGDKCEKLYREIKNLGPLEDIILLRKVNSIEFTIVIDYFLGKEDLYLLKKMEEIGGYSFKLRMLGVAKYLEYENLEKFINKILDEDIKNQKEKI